MRAGTAPPVRFDLATGRTDEAKQSLSAAVHDRLAEVGVASEDVFIGSVENGPQD